MKNKKELICVLCGKQISEEDDWKYGQNPWPLYGPEKRCCSSCNNKYVLPARGLAHVTPEAFAKIISVLAEKTKHDKY